MKAFILLWVYVFLVSCSLVSANSKSSADTKLLAYMDIEDVYTNADVLALAKAGAKGDIKQIEKLIAKGVDVNARGKINGTPLFFALQNKQGFSALIKHGADPNIIFDDGGTVLHWAAQMKDCDFLDIAIKGGGNPDLKAGYYEQAPIFKTINMDVESGIPPCFKVLIENGCDVDAKNSYGNTILVSAAGFARYDMVLELLKNGADYRFKNKYGKGLEDKIRVHESVLPKESTSYKFKKEVEDWIKANP